MSDALPLPPRPNLEQYKKLAKELRQACQSSDGGRSVNGPHVGLTRWFGCTALQTGRLCEDARTNQNTLSTAGTS